MEIESKAGRASRSRNRRRLKVVPSAVVGAAGRFRCGGGRRRAAAASHCRALCPGAGG